MPFFTAFQQASNSANDFEEHGDVGCKEQKSKTGLPQETEKAAGIVNLNEQDLAALEDDEVNDWFN